MSTELELKTLVEQGNKQIAALRSELDSVKSADSLTTEKLTRIEADLASTLEAKSALEQKLTALETAQARANVAGKTAETCEHKSAFIDFLRHPQDDSRRQALQAAEKKSVNIATPANGGYAVPSQIGTEIARIALDIGPMRQLARVVQVSTSDYSEILDSRSSGYEWVGDAATRNETQAPTIGQIAPTFGDLSASVKVSLGAIEDMAFNVESWLVESLGEKFAAAEGTAFVTGNGANKPTGFLHSQASLDKIASGDAAGLGDDLGDKLIDMIYGLKAEYRPNASFLMSSAVMASVAKIKDVNGRYLLIEPLAAGVAPTLIGRPVALDENMPGVEADALPIALGDWKRGYLIADRVGVSVLTDPYSTTGFLTIKARKRVGGIIRDPNAIKLLQIAE